VIKITKNIGTNAGDWHSHILSPVNENRAGRGPTLCRKIPFPESKQCTERFASRGPREPVNMTYKASPSAGVDAGAGNVSTATSQAPISETGTATY
jgi:hypothetical protein